MNPEAELVPVSIRRPLHVREYDLLRHAGLFADEPVELIFGVLVRCPPRKAEQDAVARALAELLSSALAERASAFHRPHLVLGDESVLQPDLVLLEGQGASISAGLTPRLIVEVGAGNEREDRSLRGTVYARHGISEFWLVSHDERVVEVYSRSENGAYQDVRFVPAGERLRLAGLLEPGIDSTSLFAVR